MANADKGGGTRREEILRNALDVFAEVGYANSTVRQIGDRSGILSGSLYSHFRSKSDMLREILDQFWRELIAKYEDALNAGSTSIEALFGLIETAVLFSGTHRSEYIVLNNEWHYLQHLPEFVHMKAKSDRIAEIWLGVLRQGVERGELRDDQDPRMMYRMLIGAVLSVDRWYSIKGEMTPREVATIFVELFVRGAGTTAPQVPRSGRSPG